MTPGELAHPNIAYHDANGRPLIGPCHVEGCPFQSLPGGGDAHTGKHAEDFGSLAAPHVPGTDYYDGRDGSLEVDDEWTNP